MNVVLNRFTGSLGRCLEQGSHIHIEATVGISGCNNLGTAVVTVLAHLGYHDTRLTSHRFGPIPPETEELLRIVPLRRLAARLGVEKVFLKGGRMSLFFVSNPDSPYYQSQAFGKVIAYMMKYTRRCDLREQNNKRSMLVKDVKTVEEAVCVLQEVVAMQVEE